MKKILLFLISAGLLFCCPLLGQKKTGSKPGKNPLLSEFATPFKVPPFEKIKVEHFLPAIKEGIKQQKEKIKAIVTNPQAPTFGNTVEALENSGILLRRVDDIFKVLLRPMSTDEMQKTAKKIAPLVSRQNDDIYLNEKLFKRIKTLYNQKDELNLTGEQNKLLETYYKNFVRGGANLNLKDKDTLKKINEKLSVLSLKFADNVLAETNAFKLVIDKKEDLAGLTQSIIDTASEAAKEEGLKGKWVFTLHKPSMIPFLQNSKKRHLREKIFKAYINRGNNNNAFDNKAILREIISLRIKKANLLGYRTYADFVLEENMAKRPEEVYNFLYRLWKPALKMAKKEAAELQTMIQQERKNFKLEPWDWWYYAEKLKKAKYDLDDEVLRPYFKLENVRNGAFALANKLYGIKFVERQDIPKYHKDVKVFEVQEADGSHIGILYVDYFPRAIKRGGAWMNAVRKQYKLDGKRVSPIITNNGNFSKPTKDKPALLTFEEVNTLFHEFGHALHGLLSDCTYYTLSGTSVPIDFVELPSQIMENWTSEPEVLKMYAKHYKTGEVIPLELVEKIKKASHFNQGFATVEYLAASFLDMDWHTLSDVKGLDVLEFETKSLNKLGLIPEIVVRYRTTYFRHIFASSYPAGYYSYIWAEVLDADAFEAFKETDLFNRKIARAFRENVLERGGTEDPMELYKKFRGAKPNVGPFLKRRGLSE